LLPAELFFFEDGLKIYAAKCRLFLEVVVVSLVGNLVVGVGEEREKHRKESNADGRRRSCLMVF
jgi:hypothetical protein